MHIEEIIIDGFKSYATRTVISGFDPHFNAITGFNGSGKSNILDAICFVLGISNLSQVRAGNLQELVYKQGQAGITKATVTIVFDNHNSNASPVGYEQYEQISVARQVIIGGRNKYMINGHTAQVSQIQNLFHSVQLNVNSPHFLIMQGRITKILNMKPLEILSMIEEAAGTRMYETKKQAALRTMIKKDRKVEEINAILAEEITPTLEKLRQEKQQYLVWAANNTELERLERFCIAYKYQKAVDVINTVDANVQQLEQNFESSRQREKKLQDRIEALDVEIDRIEREKQQKGGPNLQILKEKVNQLDQQVAKIHTQHQNVESQIKAQEEKQRITSEQRKDAEQSMKKLRREMEMKQKEVASSKTKLEAIKEKKKSVHDEMQALNAGITQTKGPTKASFVEDLAERQKELQEENTIQQQTALKIKHLEKQCKQQRTRLDQSKHDNRNLVQEQTQNRAEVDALNAKMDSITSTFDPTEEKAVHHAMKQLRIDIRQNECQIDELSSSLSSRLDFHYSDPYPNFLRESIKGVLAKLLETKHEWSALALEIVAGGKLYQVVVDNEKIAKDILKHGRLMNRVTIIPLNRISRRIIEPFKIQKAQKIAEKSGGKIWEALELIHFDQAVQPAMEYAFGNSIVCETSEIAKEVTFHRDIKVRTVTLDGDSFDPAGTLQGGSAPSNGPPMLLKLHSLLQSTRTLQSLRDELSSKQARLEQLRQDGEQYRAVQSQLELKKHQLVLIDERISQSAHAQQERDVSLAESELQEANDKLTETSSRIESLLDSIKTIKQKIQSVKQSRSTRIQALEDELKALTIQTQQAQNHYKSIKQQHSESELEIESLVQEIQTSDAAMQKIDKKIARLRHDAQQLVDQQSTTEGDLREATLQWDQHREMIQESDQKLRLLVEKRAKFSRKKTECEVSKKKHEHRKQRLFREKEDSTALVREMEQEHAWISAEKEFFGREHTDYDFEKQDSESVMQRRILLKKEQDAISLKINKKVVGMIEKAEQEYQSLMTKREIIEKDKEKITFVIEELDTKKDEALKTTWRKVNKDFGSIFSTLLPGTTAKLEPVDSETVLDGLQVSVAFGGVWKESLTELSGGQRSLLALSLILALLLFKPAPMYILDEVDAALDLSHTQNIGQMIQSHFSQSQFIIVSLKEGMFNNANVVYRTKFVDGVSTVTRTVPSKKQKRQSESPAN
uniref:Structural maintenance of chromosomes protein n=1 Tax=Albugo laibachii Nc14 TaxID=890382 RepID=F0WE71_9STRA|nr:ATSMC2 transporter putative [Albugo laibachii Nc14]|eukprot:CCA19500.1 ATSMC2 transporter putative [Albugo laibachii Nc14]